MSDNRPKVTVVITCYNKEKWIGRAIQSVENMTYTNWECVIVENGSTDGSHGVISNMVDGDGRFNVIKVRDNVGQCRGRNIGAFVGTGEYLVFLDGDDEIEPSFLETSVLYMEENKDCYAVFGDILGYYNNDESSEYISPLVGYEYSYDIELSINLFSITSVCRTRRFIEIGGFREEARHTIEDWDMWVRYLDGYDAKYMSGKVSTIRHLYVDNSLSYTCGMYTKSQEQAYNEIVELNRDIYTKYGLLPNN